MSVNGASPCHCHDPSTSVTGINIDDVVRNVSIIDIDTKQRLRVFTDVIVVEGILIRPRHGDLELGLAGRLVLTPAPFLDGAHCRRLAMSMPEEEDAALGTNLRRGKKKSETRPPENRSRVRVRSIPTLPPEPSAGEDEGSLEETDTD